MSENIKVTKELNGTRTIRAVEGRLKKTLIATLVFVLALGGYYLMCLTTQGSEAPLDKVFIFTFSMAVVYIIYVVPLWFTSVQFTYSAEASAERARLEAIEASNKVNESSLSSEDTDLLPMLLKQKRWIRYPLSALLASVAWWIYLSVPHLIGWIGIVIFGLYSLALAMDIIFWIIGVAIVVGVVSAVMSGLSSLTVPAAILLGAIIIAIAVKYK